MQATLPVILESETCHCCGYNVCGLCTGPVPGGGDQSGPRKTFVYIPEPIL